MENVKKEEKMENVKTKKKKKEDGEREKTPTTPWQMIKGLLRQSSKSVKCWSCLLSVVTLQKSRSDTCITGLSQR